MAISPLSGVRVWLSGAIPSDATESTRENILRFIRILAEQTFTSGGIFVHGAHPSLTPTLIETAKSFRDRSGRRAPLRIFSSVIYRTPDGKLAEVSEHELRKEAELIFTPRLGNNETEKDSSLLRLREKLAADADVQVVIGGKHFNYAPDDAGVPKEFNLALNRGIPIFLNTGLGGAIADFTKQFPETLRRLRNGLTKEQNDSLANEADPEKAARQIIEQIGRLPLMRRETRCGEPFRILSLDGGGIKGVFTAALLAKWENLCKLEGSTGKYFDLITGTSTGAILALGLGLGLPAEELVKFYRNSGPLIFPMMRWHQRAGRWFQWLLTKKFDATVLDAELQRAFRTTALPNPTLGDCRPRLLITSYNITSNSIQLYRTNHSTRVSGHDGELVTTIARASSSAPSFFSPTKVIGDLSHHQAVDGGLWANCPAVAGVIEAVEMLGIPPERISMLSLGTTHDSSCIMAPRFSDGLFGWSKKLVELLFKSQMQCSIKTAEALLGKERFLRIDRPSSAKSLDDVKSIPQLINLGESTAQEKYELVSKTYFNGLESEPWR